MKAKHELTNICIIYTDPQLLFMSAWSQSWLHFFVLPLPPKIMYYPLEFLPANSPYETF